MTIAAGLPAASAVYDVCVVGSGPLGVAVARRCAGQGLSVVILEAGGPDPEGSASAGPPIGKIVDPSRHAALDIAMCRAIGGTSWWWGGRSIPMDPVDYMKRSFVYPEGWPIGPEDVAPYEAAAADHLDCGRPVFSDVDPYWEKLGGGVRFSGLERWSRVKETAKLHQQELASAASIELHFGVTVEALSTAGGAVTGLRARDEAGEGAVTARHYVLANGGLGAALLLLRHRNENPAAFGGPSGALGAYYMGHTHGAIADIVLTDPAAAARVDFFLDETKTWVRRRLSIDPETQITNGILNTNFWVDNPPFHDHRHGSGVLSAVYLALCVPPIGRLLTAEAIRLRHIGEGGRYGAHLANVLLHPFAAIASVLQILRQRYVEKPWRPGFLIRNRAGRYALSYHGEQAPRRDSAVTLADDGTLSIDLRYAEEDAVSVVKAHELIDESLRASGLARLEYHMPENERVATVLAQAEDGYHQEGLIRMGTDPATSVVDRDCRTHEFANLFVASTGVFPTSGQANPTFTGVALALRLADHIVAKGKADEAR